MSNTYEIRSFNTKEGKQNCFAVRTYKTEEEAQTAFRQRVRNVEMHRTNLIEHNMPFSFLANEMQLVVYNESMTWLEEIKTCRFDS